MTDEQMMRVHAGDLADMILTGLDAQAQLDTYVRNQTEVDRAWQDQLDGAHEIYRGFRRTVQEALGFDQAELLNDDELEFMIRGLRRGQAAPFGAPFGGSKLDDPAVSRLDPDFELGAVLRFQDGYSHVNARLTQRCDNGAWRGVVEAVDGHSVFHVGDMVTVNESGTLSDITHGSKLGVSVADAVAHVAAGGEIHADDLWTRNRQQGGRRGPEVAPRCAEPAGSSFCGATIRDGACPEHGPVGPPLRIDDPWADDKAAAHQQDGPATESMQAVEEPPEVGNGDTIGRVFTRDTVDQIDWEHAIMPSDLINRLGDWWEFVNWMDGRPGLDAVFTCNALQVNHTLREVLHMHGTVWEIVRPESPVEDAHGSAADHG